MNSFEHLIGKQLIEFASEVHNKYMETVDFSVEQDQTHLKLTEMKFVIDNYRYITKRKEIEWAERNLVETLRWFNENQNKIIFKGE